MSELNSKTNEILKKYRDSYRFKSTIRKIDNAIEKEVNNGEYGVCVDIRTAYEKLLLNRPPNSLLQSVKSHYRNTNHVYTIRYSYYKNCMFLSWGTLKRAADTEPRFY